MTHLPENPYAKFVFDQAYSRWKSIGGLLATFGLLPVLWPVWDVLVEAFTIEVVSGLTAVAQIGLMLTVPERLAWAMAKRALDRARQSGTIPQWSPPPKPEPELARRFTVQDGATLIIDRHHRQARVERVGQPAALGTPDQFEKINRVRLLLVCRDGFTDVERDFLLHRANVGGAYWIVGQEPSSTLFRNHSAEDIATMITEDAKAKRFFDWRR